MNDESDDYVSSFQLKLTSLDDKNTILYRYVYKYKLPKSFFAYMGGKIYTIYDILKHHQDQLFKPLDSLMIFYENIVNIDSDYKQWIIDGNYKKVKNITNLVEYDVDSYLKWFNDAYPDPAKNKMLKKYFKNQNIIYYDGDIEELFKNFNQKGNIKIFNLILTQKDYNLVLYQLEITPDQELLTLLNKFKHKYKTLKNIKYDSGSFMNAYHEWIINTNNQFEKDFKIATTIHHIQKILPKNNLAVSPKTFDHLIKIYNPVLIDRTLPIDIDDGLDLFNDAILNASSPSVIYKNDNGRSYYKMYDSNMINDTPMPLNNTLYYYIIKGNKKYDTIYNLNDNTLQLSYTHYKNTPTDINIFPSLDIGAVVDYDMEGVFNIWDIEINEQDFLSFILNNESINKILFVDDSKFNFKKSISIKYIPLNTNTIINIELSQLFYNDDKVVDTIAHKIKLVKNNRQYIPYIQVKFKNVYHDIAFTTLVTSLLYLFKTDQNPFNQLLYHLEAKKEKDVDENLRKLKDLAPDAFVEGYANFCDVKKRPQPIDQVDIEDYLSNKIKEYKLKGKDAEHYRDYAVLNFPVNGEELHLVCDHPEDRFPYLKSTSNFKKLTTLDKEVYEDLPCCKKIAPKINKITKKEPTHLTGVTLISKPGSTGEIDVNVKYLLQNYNLEKNKFIRFGVVSPGSNYSFIHCLCVATDDAQYINTNNKEQYVNSIFKNLKNINMSVTKQELYDMSINQIIEELDKDQFFDPNLFYRLLEEYFNVNIYVFDTSLVVPRFKTFHARPLRERPCVLIYKNENQCELIINIISDTHKMLIFDFTMSKYCHQFLKNVVHTYTFRTGTENKIDTFNNLYYLANHLTFIPNIISQYIDEEGKMRALTVKVKNQRMTIMTLPSQPENLPIDLTIHYINYKNLPMTQKPTAMTISNGLMTGLWYRIYDVEYGEYIPITPIEPMNIKIGPNCNLPTSVETGSSTQHNEIGQYNFMKKILNRLLQIVQWLFLLALNKYESINDVDEFFDQYVTYTNSDTKMYNELMNIPRRLPVYENYDDYFDYISSYNKNIIKNYKLVMYSKDFYNKVKSYLKDFNLSDNDVPIYIRDYYQYVSDFKSSPNTTIFLNEQTLSAWQQNHEQIYYQVLPYTIYPYIYKTNYGKMFLIQNIEDYHYDKALSVCDYWDKHQINIGYKGNHDQINPNVNIYKVNDIDQLELVHLGDYHVIDYNYREGKIGSGKYAAMLPLL